MDQKAMESLRKVLVLRTKQANTVKEFSIAKRSISSFQREKKFLTYLVGSLDVRRTNYSCLANAIHLAIHSKEFFLIVPKHDRCEFGEVIAWVNVNSLESLECYERLLIDLPALCASIGIPYILDIEKIKDYEICASPI
jgi:hypothetical protein